MNKTRIQKYTQDYGCRYTNRQKKKFIQVLQEEMREIGYEGEEIKGKSFLSRSHSFLFGNLKQLKTLIVVPYDTPEKKFWPKVVYFPLDGTRTASKTMVATYVPLLILFVVVFGGVYFIQPLLTSMLYATMMSVAMFAMTMLLVYIMLHGVQNHHNYNRNSVAIIAALELAQQLNKDERRKVGFLFTDKNANRFLGADSCMKHLEEKGKSPNMICLNCIGKGTTLQIGYLPSNRKLANEVSHHYPKKEMEIEMLKLSDDMRLQSSMSCFKKAIMIACGDIDEEHNLSIYGTGTRKDIEFDGERVEDITTMLYQYLHNLK